MRNEVRQALSGDSLPLHRLSQAGPGDACALPLLCAAKRSSRSIGRSPAPPEWLRAPGPGDQIGEPVLSAPPANRDALVSTGVMPRDLDPPNRDLGHQLAVPEKKVDAIKLVQGKPAFTADIDMRGMLVAKVLHSPVAHARIKHIDASRPEPWQAWPPSSPGRIFPG